MKSRTMKFTLDCSKVGNQLCIDGIRQGDANSIVFIISLANGINLLDIVAGKEESVVVTMYGKNPMAQQLSVIVELTKMATSHTLSTLRTQLVSALSVISLL